MRHQSLSSTERAGLELALTRMPIAAFGSLATVPLFCLGERRVPDIRSVIQERYEVWRSFLVVIREILRCGPPSLKIANPTVESLFGVTDNIRDAYIELAEYESRPPEMTMRSHQKLVGRS